MPRLRSIHPESESAKRERPLLGCRKCPRSSNQLRDGMCFACYLRERRGTSLPDGAQCFTCQTPNPIVLVMQGPRVLCLNCRALERAQVA